MGGTIPRQVDLGCIRTVAEREPKNKPINSISLWSMCQFLSLGSYMNLCLSPGWTETCKLKQTLASQLEF